MPLLMPREILIWKSIVNQPLVRPAILLGDVGIVDLLVQSENVVHVSDTEQSAGQEVKNSCEDLALVKTVNAKPPDEGQQHPRLVVIDRPRAKTIIGFPIHGRNQE